MTYDMTVFLAAYVLTHTSQGTELPIMFLPQDGYMPYF